MLNINFSNTELAYRYLDNFALRRAHFIFSSMDKPFLAKWGPRALQWAFDYKLPLSPLIRKTLFAHFCGGESLQECKTMLGKLQALHVGVVLDFAEEAVEKEAAREKACVELLRALDFLKENQQRFAVFKPSTLMSFKILEKLSAKKNLSLQEQTDYEYGIKRARRILIKAKELGLSVLVDAEESWIQEAIDTWAYDLIREFNKERAVLYQTVQIYRKDRRKYLEQLFEKSQKEQVFLGIKMVRGAYMEKERERAKRLSYPSPIHDTKEDCDRDFDNAVEFCMQHIDKISLFLGTHNEASTMRLTRMMLSSSLSASDPRIVFSQLFGMSDTLTFNLAASGFNTVKYLPYGPVRSAIPYLMRRSQENASVQGQMGRELIFIRQEMKRRGL